MISASETIKIAALGSCLLAPSLAGSAEHITYMVLAETVEPIIIVRDGDAMAGGLMTDIVKLIFADSDYEVEPKILPWQRMLADFNQIDDWIAYGIPGSFSDEVAFDMSELPIFPFNHVAVTMKDADIKIRSIEDLNNKTLILVENFHYAGLDDYLNHENDAADANTIGILRSFSPGGTLEMLRHRRGDVVIDWEARIIYNLAAAGLDIDDVEFHDATNIVPTKKVHLYFSARLSDEFRSFVNDRIRMLADSGKLAELVGKYYEPAEVPDF